VSLRRRSFMAAAVALGVSGCLDFHRGPLPGAPKGATFAEIEGARIHYVDEGEGPTVVLIHGFASSLGAWSGVRKALAGKHRVIALDLKGFGYSDRPEGDYSPAAEAKIVLGLLDKRGVEGPVAVVAHSWVVVYPQCGHFPMIEAVTPSTRDLVESSPRRRPPRRRQPRPRPRAPRRARASSLSIPRSDPLPLSDPKGQALFVADMRCARTSRVRPRGRPWRSRCASTRRQLVLGSGACPRAPPPPRPAPAPITAVRIKRAYGEVLTPIGAARRGAHGQPLGPRHARQRRRLPDCDSGDAADRIAFVTPMLGHRVGAGVRLLVPAGPTVHAAKASARRRGPRGRRAHASRSPCSRSATTRARAPREAGKHLRVRRVRRPTAGRTRTSPRPTCRSPAARPINSSQVMARGYTRPRSDGGCASPCLRTRRAGGRAPARLTSSSRPLPGVLLRDPADLDTSWGRRWRARSAIRRRFGGGSTRASPAATPRLGSA
jgi:hypothetical protein